MRRFGLLALAALLAACASDPGPFGKPAHDRYGTIATDLTRPPVDAPDVRAAQRLGPSPAPPEAETLGAETLRPQPGFARRLSAENGPLQVSVEEAVVLALNNNRALGLQLYGPVVAGTFEQQERAVFDPVVFGEIALTREELQQTDRATGQLFSVTGQAETYRAGVTQRLPTGTDLTLEVQQQRTDSSRTPEQQRARVGLSLTQALLRGRGLDANLARVRQAEIDTLASLYELRGFTAALVAEVERAYWDHVLAGRRIAIFEEAARVAEQQLEDVDRRIAVGVLPEPETAAARAELAFRRQGLIDAISRRELTRTNLLRLLSPESGDGWETIVDPVDEPEPPETLPDPVVDHVALGLRLRPELSEARLRVERGGLDVIQTRNGLLPRLDAFLNLGKTGYADSFGRSFTEIGGPAYEATGGLRWELPIANRAANAAHTRARATRRQAELSVENLAQLVVADVRSAHVEVERAREQIEPSATRRALQEEVVRAETAKFQVGRGTALAVAQAQRDLLQSRLDEVEAIVAYRTALIDLYRLDGSLLARRGIEAEGNEAVDLLYPR